MGARGPKRGLLSGAYRKVLEQQASEDLKQAMGLEDGATFADVIAKNVVRRAIGLVPDDKICFRAITELRETTEGKTPEKAIIASNINPELSNLAEQVAIGAARARGENLDDTDEDASTEDSEAAFHEAVDNGQ